MAWTFDGMESGRPGNKVSQQALAIAESTEFMLQSLALPHRKFLLIPKTQSCLCDSACSNEGREGGCRQPYRYQPVAAPPSVSDQGRDPPQHGVDSAWHTLACPGRPSR